jgi:hypothetical protein
MKVEQESEKKSKPARFKSRGMRHPQRTEARRVVHPHLLDTRKILQVACFQRVLRSKKTVFPDFLARQKKTFGKKRLKVSGAVQLAAERERF